MPLYLRQKDPTKEGHFLMVEVDPAVADAQPIAQPASPTLSAGGRAKRYSCTACTPPTKFASVGVMSIHFQRRHKDLMEDKDSWRKYMETDGSDANS